MSRSAHVDLNSAMHALLADLDRHNVVFDAILSMTALVGPVSISILLQYDAPFIDILALHKAISAQGSLL